MNKNSGTNNHNHHLKYFTVPEILQQIGAIRIPKFLGGFREDLADSPLAAFCDLSPEPSTDFSSLAVLFANSASLPNRLRKTLLTLEAAASPLNSERLEETLHRCLPCISLNRNCPLDCALELWFAVPEELSQFNPPPEPELTAVPASPGKPPGHSDTAIPPASADPTTITLAAPLSLEVVEPWPESLDGKLLLDDLATLLKRFIILPKWAAETFALWIIHTYAFKLRDVTTYIGVESPEKQCGKTTLLTVLSELVNRAVASSNVSPPAFFRVIEDLSPTLLIDEADTFLQGNEPLKGILNAGYKRKTAHVLRVGSAGPAANGGQPLGNGNGSGSGSSKSENAVMSFSCWCPKVISQIGRLPDTLADRCIIIRMQRKAPNEQCARLRDLDATSIKRQCARFVLDHQANIANAQPELPSSLSDRAAEIWEPLLALADLAGGHWPDLARQAAVHLSASAQHSNPLASLLLDILLLFIEDGSDRLLSRDLVDSLNLRLYRPWAETLRGRELTEIQLAYQLRGYGVRPRTMRKGNIRAKGYFKEDLNEVFRRYIPKAELQSLIAESREADAPEPANRKDDQKEPATTAPTNPDQLAA
jgi:hypothetical protein